MDAVLQWGISLVLAIQAHRTPELDAVFRAITALGGKMHMYIVPFVVWSLSYRHGARMSITLLLSAFANFELKDLFAQPRPFDMEPRIGPDRESGYGIPSGHAQHTAVEWMLIAQWVAQPWFRAVALVLIALIGFSRVYLGVHFPTDVAAGWLLAAAAILLHLRYADAVAARLARMHLGTQLGAGAFASLLILATLPLASSKFVILALAGLFLGVACGMVLCNRYRLAPEGGEVWQRMLRYAVGIEVLIRWVDYSAALIPRDKGITQILVVYAVFASHGVWVMLGAPAVFRLLRLSPPAPHT